MIRTLSPRKPSPTTGATSEVHHHSALVERHWVTVSVPRRDRITDHRRRKVMAEARAAAAPLIASAGLHPDTGELWERPGELGWTWTIVVGECHTIPAERDPYWVWTPRWRHWLSQLTAALRDEPGHPSIPG